MINVREYTRANKYSAYKIGDDLIGTIPGEGSHIKVYIDKKDATNEEEEYLIRYYLNGRDREMWVSEEFLNAYFVKR